MIDNNIETEITDFIKEYGNMKCVGLAISKIKKFKDYLDQRYPMLSDKKYTVGFKLYWLINKIEEFPKCSVCGRENKTHRCNISTGYATDVCSVECANNTSKFDKMKRTMIEKYGVDNCQKNKDISDKTKRTNVERYGVDNPSKSKAIKDKIFKTKFERYGDGNFTNSDLTKKTNIEKYGCENVFSSKTIIDKIHKTMKERYGNIHPMMCDEIRKNALEKMTAYSIHNSYENHLASNPYSYPDFTEEYYLNNRRRKDGYVFVCRQCGKKYRSRIHNGHIRRCPDCYPTVTTSIKEKEIYDFISSICNSTIERKNRTVISPLELDMYIPEKKIAIEFDGLYWHSELNGIDRNYHLNKTEMCAKSGINLIHIFEDEWDLKQNIVKSRIRNLLGSYDKTIYARKCNVKEIDWNTSSEFVDKNHMQGSSRSSINLGLFYGGELVSVMTFCKPRIALGNRKNEDGEWELLRFCSKLGYHVIGGAGKLLKFFERTHNPKTLLTYADRRWSSGNLYGKLGFVFIRNSKPNYWYIDNGCDHRFHRFSFRKSVLKDKLKTFDETKTEYENMKMNKFTRIYDCGNMVFMKKY